MNSITKIIKIIVGCFVLIGGFICGSEVTRRIFRFQRERHQLIRRIQSLTKTNPERFSKFNGIVCVIDPELEHHRDFIVVAYDIYGGLLLTSRSIDETDVHDLVAMWQAVGHLRLGHLKELKKHYIATGQGGIVLLEQYHAADAYAAQQMTTDAVVEHLDYLRGLAPSAEMKALFRRRIQKLYLA